MVQDKTYSPGAGPHTKLQQILRLEALSCDSPIVELAFDEECCHLAAAVRSPQGGVLLWRLGTADAGLRFVEPPCISNIQY